MCVSIHVPTRGTTQHGICDSTYALFQSTFPRGERPVPARQSHGHHAGFNPRSHEGNDVIIELTKLGKMVSIHVPTRGTTSSYPIYADFYRVSIHVPTRGTTMSSSRAEKRSRCFNPRSHEGNDTSGKPERHPCTCFNPRSHEGNDDSLSLFL